MYFTVLYTAPINQILMQIISKTRKSNNTENIILIKIKYKILNNDHSITMLGCLNEEREMKKVIHPGKQYS